MLTPETVRHIAELAKLELTERETALYVEQLSKILAYAERLNALDTDSIAPTAQAIYRRNVMRPDEPRPSLAPDEALADAPQRCDDLFRVKQILD